jgi:tetratricopeptide (TPR) repeat protein
MKLSQLKLRTKILLAAGLILVLMLCKIVSNHISDVESEFVVEESPEVKSLTQEAFNEAIRLKKQYPGRDNPLYLLGLACLRTGRSAEAAKYWQQCLELNPRYGVAYTGLAGINYDKAQYEQALALYQKGLSFFQNDPQVRLNIGKTLMSLGRFDEAIKVLDENLMKYPQAVLSHIHLGQAHLQLKQYENAKIHYEKFLQVDPQNKKVCYGLTKVYARLGQKDKSTEYRKRFASLQSSSIEKLEWRNKTYDDVHIMKQNVAEIYVQLGLCYKVYGNNIKAEELWKKAASLDTKNSSCRRSLAFMYQETARNQEALGLFQELCELEPEKAMNYMNFGSLNAQLGQFGTAETAFRKVVNLAPDRPEGYQSLVMLYVQAGQKLPEAKRLATILVQKKPTANSYFILAQTCIRTGDQPGTLKALEKAMKLDPKNQTYRMLYQQAKR